MLGKIIRRLLPGPTPACASSRLALGFLVLSLALGAVSGPVYAEPEDHPNHPVTFSLFYPISTNQDREISTYFRLNLLYSDVGAVRGLDINGIGGRIHRDMVGLQFNGIYSHILGDLRGISVSLGAGFVQSDVSGVQYSGMVNFVRGDFTGLQLTSFFNYAEGSFNGVQASAVFNLNDGDVKYFQYATIANAVAGDVTGVQAAAGINYVNDSMFGCQLALGNFAMNIKGVQIGLGNVAGQVKGAQVGFINVAREVDGIPFGMFNFVENGDIDWVTFGSNIAAVSTGVRSIYRKFYSILALGVGDIQDSRNDTAFLSWHYGYAVPIKGWKFGADVGFVHIMPTPSADPDVNDKNQFAIQVRAITEMGFSDKFKVFGGIGMSQRYTGYSTENTSYTDPLVVLGVSLY